MIGAAFAADTDVPTSDAKNATTTLMPEDLGPNLMKPKGTWTRLGRGVRRQGDTFLCDNGTDANAQRGFRQYVRLDQIKPEPIIVTAWSKAEEVTGNPNRHYAIYLDIRFTDGSRLPGQFQPFSVGTHDWERRDLLLTPEKPIEGMDVVLLLRHHAGKAWFRLPELRVVRKSDETIRREIVGQMEQVKKLAAGNQTIAVLGFADKGPSIELAVLRTALAEGLSSELAQAQGVYVVERMQVEDFLRESSLKASGLIDDAARQRAGQALAAQFLLSGTFQAVGSTITVEATLHATGIAKPHSQWKEAFPTEELFEFQQRLARNVLEAVGIKSPQRRAPPKPQPKTLPTVAVLVLKNLSPSPRLEPMENGFADSLQANLGALKQVRLVERERLRAVLKEQKLTLSGLVDPATAIRVGRLLNADRLIYGSFVELGDNLRFDVRLADTKTACVLWSESVVGKTEQFASSLETLALRLAADLAVDAPPEAADLVKATTPTRRLEAALHVASGENLLYAGKYTDAAASFGRALVVEPDNSRALVGRLRSWLSLKEYAKVIDAGRQAITDGRVPKPFYLMNEFLSCFYIAHIDMNMKETYRALCREIKARTPNAHFLKQMERDVGFSDFLTADSIMLEEALRTARASGNRTRYMTALGQLDDYYYYNLTDRSSTPASRERMQRDPAYAKKVAETTRRTAIRADELRQEIVRAAKGSSDERWHSWVNNMIERASPTWLDERGDFQDLLTYAEQEQRLLDIKDAVASAPNVGFKVYSRLADMRMRRNNPEDAIAAYRLAHDSLTVSLDEGPSHRDTMPPDTWDQQSYPRRSDLDHRITMLHWIAWLHHKELKHLEAAALAYRQILEDHGYATFKTAGAVRGLKECGRELPPLPRPAALVWGGGDRAYLAYSDLLKSQGFRVDRAAIQHITGGNLAPYTLLIMVRQGMKTYVPNDFLAVRGFVASGGSLLVVVSPGWEPSQPANVNPLLSMFGMQADSEMIYWADSTQITRHPITEGLAPTMAKCAVALKTAPEASLIRSGDKTLLAAAGYRKGRVVVASFGQWFLPDTRLDPNKYYPRLGYEYFGVPNNKRPLETAPRLQLPLLKRVLTWLIEPHVQNNSLTAERKPYADALYQAMLTESGAAPREQLARDMERLIAVAAPGIWKEEALWAAGEASLQLTLDVRQDDDEPYHHVDIAASPEPASEYFQRLIDQFPDSPLRPYAQWRLAECQFCNRILQAQGDNVHAPDLQGAVAWYQKVRAEEGSYAWAWTQLRLGMLFYRAGEYAEAERHFRAVAERMGAGAEKTMAVLSVATCNDALGKPDEAARWYKTAYGMPNVRWASGLPYFAWGPPAKDGFLWGPTRATSKAMRDKIDEKRPHPSKSEP
jgi:TolB-like protein